MKFLEKNNICIIAEIGVNHEGGMGEAIKMLELASQTGVNYVKFQSYTPFRYVASNDQVRLTRVQKFALTQENFQQLSLIAHELGVGFISTPLTEDWVELLDPLCPAFKIASGDIAFKPVIQKVARTGKPIIMSTGAATIEEIDQAINWVGQEVGYDNIKDRLILMHCVSAYPTPIEEANILSIPYLKERYKLRVGYSNHVIGMNACLAAIALGADVIEVHFTDRKENREFRDHALSFDQKDLNTFIQAANEIHKSLGKYEKVVQSCESQNIQMIRKGIIAARDIKNGEIISEDDLMYARPAKEFSSNEIDLLIGKRSKKDISKGYLISRDAI